MARFHPYWLWLVLAIPAFGFTGALINSPDSKIIGELLHPTGEFSARFLIIAMLASPLILIFKGRSFPRWLQKNRRYFGVAAFGYALFHTILYLIDKGAIDPILSDAPNFAIWTGWVAFLIFVPLAITSTDRFVHKLGRRWKTLQRTTYMAAVLTLLHWAALHEWGGVGPALVHFGPLAALEAYRLWYWTLRARPPKTAC